MSKAVLKDSTKSTVIIIPGIANGEQRDNSKDSASEEIVALESF